MLYIIDNIIQSKNIEWYYDFIRNKKDCGEFYLKFKLKNIIGDIDYYFILDKSMENNFNFSVEKDYIEGTNSYESILVIEGDTKDGQMFSILGYEIERSENGN